MASLIDNKKDPSQIIADNLKYYHDFWNRFGHIVEVESETVVNNACLAILIKYMCKKLAKIDLSTSFGYEWEKLIKKCMILIQPIHDIYQDHNSFTDESTHLYQIEQYNPLLSKIYFNTVVDDKKWNPVDKFSKDSLESCSVINLVKEFIERVRYWGYQLTNEEKNSMSYSLYNAFNSFVMSIPEPVPVMGTNIKGELVVKYHEEPYVTSCKDILKLAVSAEKRNNLVKDKYKPPPDTYMTPTQQKIKKIQSANHQMKTDIGAKKGKIGKHGNNKKNKDKYIPKSIQREKDRLATLFK
jgi:hypothetical protein